MTAPTPEPVGDVSPAREENEMSTTQTHESRLAVEVAAAVEPLRWWLDGRGFGYRGERAKALLDQFVTTLTEGYEDSDG